MAANREIDPELQAKFRALRNNWKDETAHLGSMSQIVENSYYQQIIKLGEDVLPILFNELQTDPDWWFYALREITGADPILEDDQGNLPRMTRSWLAWWEENK